MRILPSHGRPIYTLAYSPDGRMLAAGDGEGMDLWNVDAGVAVEVKPRNVRTQRSRAMGFSLPIRCARFSNDGEWLVVGLHNWPVHLWSIGDQDFDVKRGPTFGTALEGLAVAPNGRTLAVACDNLVRQCTIPDLANVKTSVHTACNTIFALSYSPDGHALAIGAGTSGRSGLVLLQWSTGTSTDELPGHRGPVLSVGFSPNSHLLASGSADHTIRLWDVRRAELLGVLQGHTDVVHCIVFAADGRTLISASWDGTVKLWDVSSQRERTTFTWHRGSVHAVAIAPDGMTAATAGQDGAIVIWDVDC